MLKNKLFSLIVVIIVGGFLFLTGCGQSQEIKEQDSQAIQELEKIIVSEPVRGELWAPVYLAQTLGYFEEEGLDVEFITIQGGAAPTAVVSGDAQFGLYGVEGILKLNEMGQNSKLLVTTLQRFPYVLAAKPEYNTVEDLRGKRIGGGDAASSPRAFVRAAVKYGGLDPEKDVNFTDGAVAGMVAAMENNDIQATFTYGIFKQQLMENGNHLLVNTYDPEIHEKVIGSPYYHTHIVFATDKYIEENPEIVQRFVNAIYRGIKWTNEHSVEEIADKLAPLFSGREDTLITSLKEFVELELFTSTGEFTESGMEAANRLAQDTGMIMGDVPMDKAVNNTFIKKAQEQ